MTGNKQMDEQKPMHGFMDRSLQREILCELRDTFPETLDYRHLERENRHDKIAALAYLEGHHLVDVDWSREIGSKLKKPLWAKITVQGLDFIADDGGLSTILNVVTVQLHEDTIRQLLLDKIDAAPITPEEHSSLQQAIRSLPGKALGKLTGKLLDAGADRLVTETPQLGTWLTQLVTQLS